MKKNKLTNEEINMIIKHVDGTMAIEGVSLTDENKQIAYNCLNGKSTFEEERKKILDRYKEIYGK